MIPNEPNSADATDLEGYTEDGVEGAAPGAGIGSPDGASPDILPPDATLPKPEDEESIEEFIERLLDGYVSPPRPVLPKPAPAPRILTHDDLPEHLKAIHPKGGYVAMRLLSRMMSDLTELTQGKRAATYPEVEEYLGYALRAEGLAPRPYPPSLSGQSQALRQHATATMMSAGTTREPPRDSRNASADPAYANDLSALARQAIVNQPQPNGNTSVSKNGMPGQHPPVDAGTPAAGDPLVKTMPDGSPGASPQAVPISGNVQKQAPPAIPGTANAPASDAPPPPILPRKSSRIGKDRVIAAKIDDKLVSRLVPRDIIATPAIKAAAVDAIKKVKVASDGREIMAFGYLMPDGKIDVRVANGMRDEYLAGGKPSGLGKVIFGIHGHRTGDGSNGMVDDPEKNDGFGDTKALKSGIPMATVYDDKIGWHEMIKGQLIFTAPANGVTSEQMWSIQQNLNRSQKLFLSPGTKAKK